MIKHIAIRGQEDGQKIITLLEDIGGTNFYSLTGKGENVYYYIKSDGKIWYIFFDDMRPDEWKLYTYDSFKEKYPFVIGDKVIVQGWSSPGFILRMHIKNFQFVYDIAFMEDRHTIAIDVCADCMKFYNHANNDVLTIKENMENDIKFDLEKYSYEVKDGKLIVNVKNLTYPKTYVECCKVIANSKPYAMNEHYTDVTKLLQTFQTLIICRNAYWKIAGEQMGLDKPWDSTYGCGEWGYWFGYSINENKIYLQDSRILVNHTLVFPTKEMRDAFYENFKDLIEQCKELL